MVGDAGGVNVFVMDNHPENGGSFHIYSQLMRLDGGRVALSKGAAYCASHGLSCLYFGVAPSKDRTRPATDPVAVF